MTSLLKYLKPFIGAILLIIVLLFIQAQLDLLLPDKMSAMVNVGIGQQGITESVPEAITDDTMNRLQLVLSPTEMATIQAGYQPADGAWKLNQTSSALEQTLNKGWFILAGYGLSGQVDLTPEESLAHVQSLSPAIQSAIPNQMIQAEYRALGIDLEDKQSDYILRQGGLMLLIAFLSLVSTMGVAFLSARLAAGLGRNLRAKVFDRVLAMSGRDFPDVSISSLITRSTNDVTQIQNLIVMLFRIMFYAPVLAFGAVIKIRQLNASMTWLVALAVGVILVLLLSVFGYAVPKFKLMQKLTDRLNLVTRQTLTGLLVVRAFNNQAEEQAKFADVSGQVRDTMLRVSRVMVTLMPLMMLVMNGVSLAIIWFGAKQIDLGQLQVGDLMAFIQYAIQIIMSFLMFSMISFIFPRASVSAKRVSEIIEQPLMLPDGQADLQDKTPTIRFEGVHFAYEDTEEAVLKDITFTIPYGATVGVLGGTGSGKTSLIKLLLRFYDPDQGRILFGDQDLRDIKLNQVREAISYAPQTSTLFSGTIESNITFGRPIESDKLDQVTQVAQASEFITADELGFDKSVAQLGANFSGGQKQRLQIARTLYKGAPILLFDDSFSALDFATDARLRQAIREDYADVTKIVIAQRISSVRDADLILVLDDGQLVGQGSHAELEKTNQVYQEILQSQIPQEALND